MIAYTTHQGLKTVCFGNVKLDGLDLGVRVIESRYGWAFGVYESVNVLGGAMRTDFVPQCIFKA